MYLAFISYKYLLLVIICEISLSFNNTDNLFGWHKNDFRFKLLTFIKSTHSWIKLNIEIFCQNWVRVHLRGNGVKDKKDCKNWFRLNKGHNFSKSIFYFPLCPYQYRRSFLHCLSLAQEHFFTMATLLTYLK